MSDGVHLLIPSADQRQPRLPKRFAALEDLPRLERLLARLAPQAAEAGDETTVPPPHDARWRRLRLVAAADGARSGQPGRWSRRARCVNRSDAWARITTLPLASGHRSREAWPIIVRPAELDARNPRCAGGHAILTEQDRHRTRIRRAHAYWLARGECPRPRPRKPPDRVVGRTTTNRPRRRRRGRLQQEMQMLLYTHEMNESVSRSGRCRSTPSFWVQRHRRPDAHTQRRSPPRAQAHPLPARRRDDVRRLERPGLPPGSNIDAKECASMGGATRRQATTSH